jgi:hypothetical protein
MENGRAFRPIFQLCARDFFQRRQIPNELIDRQRFAGSKFASRFFHVRKSAE